MFYDEQPVYHDPPSNTKFGFQDWSMERVAEYYYVTGAANAKVTLDKWVNWAMSNTQLPSDGSYQIPRRSPGRASRRSIGTRLPRIGIRPTRTTTRTCE